MVTQNYLLVSLQTTTFSRLTRERSEKCGEPTVNKKHIHQLLHTDFCSYRRGSQVHFVYDAKSLLILMKQFTGAQTKQFKRFDAKVGFLLKLQARLQFSYKWISQNYFRVNLAKFFKTSFYRNLIINMLHLLKFDNQVTKLTALSLFWWLRLFTLD